ncbi:MAG: Uma2 family endonuclease [Terriglobia bacterium]|jgi:Uma2 family endonuclease
MTEITYVSLMPKNGAMAKLRRPVVLNSKASVKVYNALMGVEVIPKITFEEFRQFPVDGKRYELIHGYVHFLPTPSTRHQMILGNAAASLGNYVDDARLGMVLFAPLDVRLDPDTALQPDLMFISQGRAEIIQENFIAGAPDLAVEILLSSTAAHDRATKLPLYGEAGIPEVWLVDSQAKTVDVLKLEGKKYLLDAILAGDQILISDLFPGWQLPLHDLFDFRGRF